MSNKLELLVRKCARELRDKQICVLYKVPEEMQQTPCDFIGYTPTGRCIMIECKQVKRTSLPIGKKPGLLPHQWKALDDAEKAGCLSLILWQNDGAIAVMQFFHAQWVGEKRKSIAWTDIDEDDIVTPQELCCVIEDFVSPPSVPSLQTT